LEAAEEVEPPAPSSDVCGTTSSSYIYGAASSPTVGRGPSLSLEEREELRSWSVDGSRLGLPLGLLCLCDVSASASVSSACGVSLDLM